MFRTKLERSFLSNCFVTCAFHSQYYTSILMQYRGNPLEKQVPSDIREHGDANLEKENSLRQNLERSFLGKYSVISVITSQK